MIAKGLLRDARSVSVGLTSTVLLSVNPRRWAVIISCPNANRVTLSFGGPAVLDAGINLFAGGPALILVYDHLGACLHEDIFAIAATGAQTIGVVDIFWP